MNTHFEEVKLDNEKNIQIVTFSFEGKKTEHRLEVSLDNKGTVISDDEQLRKQFNESWVDLALKDKIKIASIIQNK